MTTMRFIIWARIVRERNLSIVAPLEIAREFSMFIRNIRGCFKQILLPGGDLQVRLASAPDMPGAPPIFADNKIIYQK